jgi:hypothetical protein
MNKTGWTLTIIAILIIVAAIILFMLPGKTKAPTLDTQATTTPVAETPAPQNPAYEDMLVVESLKDNDAIASPLTITGKARGGWYFEASFPVEIKNASGTVIAQGPAKAQGDWMTQDYVPFSVTLPFPAQAAGSKGTVVLHNDNPSGMPENDKSLEIPVTF